MTGKRLAFGAAAAAVAAAASAVVALQTREYKSGIVWPEPKAVAPGKADNLPPADAVVLFDGKDLSRWTSGENWEVKDGVATARKSDITTKDAFGDCQFHIEFATPEKVEGKGQGRGNSGVFLMGKYEVQILDSVDNPTYFDGQCAAVYKQSPPMVNVSRGPGEWQTYDIVFTAPRFAPDGKVAKPAYVTVVHNGAVVHNHFELLGGTFYDRPPAYEKHAERLPVRLQFHGNPVRFRNIWVRELKPIEGKKPE
jgi:hypothetical protein